MITVALDAMSGDHGAEVMVPSAFSALEKYSSLKIILVGDQEQLQAAIKKEKTDLSSRLTINNASQIVEMDDFPSQALRYKKDSSMRVTINLVKSGEAQAAVSAGNTGALMATARFVLKTVSHVDRPAIMAHIPADNALGFVRVLDLGANVDSTAEQLLQFAVMGSVVAETVSHIERPRIALLNIGEEEIKGNEQVKGAAELLSNRQDLNYVGFAEGGDIFVDMADVIVCDGFVGNVSLKTMEGAAKVITKVIKEAYTKNILTKLVALLSKPILGAVIKRLDPAKHNGASLLGLRGIVVKSHGSTGVKGTVAAIEHAVWEVENNVIDCIEKQLSSSLGEIT